MSSRTSVASAYIAMCLIWGSTWMMIKIGLRGAPPVTSIAVRMTVASLMVAILLRAMRVPFPRDARFVRLGLFNGIFNVGLPYIFVYFGEERISSGLAAVLYSTMPLMVALLARAWLGDRLTVRKMAGIALGMVGVGIIFSHNLNLGPAAAAGTALVLASVACSTVGTVATKKWGHGFHPVASLLIPFATSAALATLLALAIERPLQLDYSPATWGTIVYLAALGSVTAFTLFFFVMQRIDVTVVSYQTFIIPIVAVVLGFAFLGETISSRVALGAGLILAGIALATFARAPRLVRNA
ncbi:MAG TPA: EamA family transporter [Candidatus Krumholzibacteria bacterium]